MTECGEDRAKRVVGNDLFLPLDVAPGARKAGGFGKITDGADIGLQRWRANDRRSGPRPDVRLPISYHDSAGPSVRYCAASSERRTAGHGPATRVSDEKPVAGSKRWMA